MYIQIVNLVLNRSKILEGTTLAAYFCFINFEINCSNQKSSFYTQNLILELIVAGNPAIHKEESKNKIIKIARLVFVWIRFSHGCIFEYTKRVSETHANHLNNTGFKYYRLLVLNC